jgi:molecular chaperone GrpE
MEKKTQIEIQDENDLTDSDDLANDAAETTPLSTPELAPADDIQSDLANKLEAAEKESRENYDRLLRVSAEFDNYKKRTSREMQDLAKFANERLLQELLTVVDNLERAVASCEHDPEQPDPVLQGVQLTLSEVVKLLERYQVSPIQAMRQPFDPTFHQAMMQEEVDDHPPNTVVREMQKGYLLHDRLLRPALVAVSKAKEKKADDSPTD